MYVSPSKPAVCPQCGSTELLDHDFGLLLDDSESILRWGKLQSRRAAGDLNAAAWDCAKCNARIYNSNDFSKELEPPIVGSATIDWSRVGVGSSDVQHVRQPIPRYAWGQTKTDATSLMKIARALVAQEQSSPNTIRLVANPRFLFTAQRLLKNIGISKRLFKNPSQHIYDSITTNVSAMEAFLRYAVLIGYPEGKAYPCWNGYGELSPARSSATLREFRNDGETVLLLILLGAAEELIRPFLNDPWVYPDQAC